MSAELGASPKLRRRRNDSSIASSPSHFCLRFFALSFLRLHNFAPYRRKCKGASDQHGTSTTCIINSHIWASQGKKKKKTLCQLVFSPFTILIILNCQVCSFLDISKIEGNTNMGQTINSLHPMNYANYSLSQKNTQMSKTNILY